MFPPALGAGSRRFESSHPDNNIRDLASRLSLNFFGANWRKAVLILIFGAGIQFAPFDPHRFIIPARIEARLDGMDACLDRKWEKSVGEDAMRHTPREPGRGRKAGPVEGV